MKKILAIYFSQTGQLKEIMDNVLYHFLQQKEKYQVDFLEINPVKPFPFPWNKHTFFDVMPETYLQIPVNLEPVPENILNQDYDLIFLGYQPWFLSPSLPFSSFLKTDDAKTLLKNKPVITVNGCRNMWVSAQEKVKLLLKDAHADLVGNIVLIDRHINHVSVLTIVSWMLTGSRYHKLKFLPRAGVSEKDVEDSRRFGKIAESFLEKNNFDGLQDELIKANAVILKPLLIFTELRGNKMFEFWAKKTRSKGPPLDEKRKIWLKFFYIYLYFAIWVIAPIVSIFFLIVYLPLKKTFANYFNYFASVKLKNKK